MRSQGQDETKARKLFDEGIKKHLGPTSATWEDFYDHDDIELANPTTWNCTGMTNKNRALIQIEMTSLTMPTTIA